SALSKRQVYRAHSTTRGNLGLAFTRWRALKERMRMKIDTVLARFLMERYVPAVIYSLFQCLYYCSVFPIILLAGRSTSPTEPPASPGSHTKLI
uniref:Uncharacterized protein n=1 Tax=Myripristis murdjan TaxID=586833 RepID=A0A667XSL2_9TELE